MGGKEATGGSGRTTGLTEPLDLGARVWGCEGREEMRGSCRGRRGEESAARLCFSGGRERERGSQPGRKAFSAVVGEGVGEEGPVQGKERGAWREETGRAPWPGGSSLLS